jgi:hypothetical protein
MSMRDNSSKVSIFSLSLLSAHLIPITFFHRWKPATPSEWARFSTWLSLHGLSERMGPDQRYTVVVRVYSHHPSACIPSGSLDFVDAGRALCNISHEGFR